MNRILLSASALALMTGAALAQNPTLTAAETGGTHVKGNGLESPAGMCWFNGTLDFRNGLSSERNTAVAESWTFDDVNFPGGSVTGMTAYFIPNLGTQFSAVDIEVYQGMAEGTFGTLKGSAIGVTTYTLTPTGNNAFGRDEFRLDATLGAGSFNLAAGTYHVGIRLVGVGSGQAFVVTTSGAGAIGTPPGNNGNSFFQSSFFGFPLPTKSENVFGTGPWDCSYGLVCGGGGGSCNDFAITQGGTCPGPKTISWSGAPSGATKRVIYTSSGGSGGVIPPGNPCAGTTICIGLAGVTLHPNSLPGTPSGTSPNFTAPCGLRVQLITQGGCDTSNAIVIN